MALSEEEAKAEGSRVVEVPSLVDGSGATSAVGGVLVLALAAPVPAPAPAPALLPAPPLLFFCRCVAARVPGVPGVGDAAAGSAVPDPSPPPPALLDPPAPAAAVALTHAAAASAVAEAPSGTLLTAPLSPPATAAATAAAPLGAPAAPLCMRLQHRKMPSSAHTAQNRPSAMVPVASSRAPRMGLGVKAAAASAAVGGGLREGRARRLDS